MESIAECFQHRGVGKNPSQKQRTSELDQRLDQVLEGSRVGMRKIGRFIDGIDAQAFQAVQAAAPHHKRAQRTGLVGANDDQVQFPVFAENSGAGLHPRKLMHRAVGGVGKQIPSPGFVLDGTEFLHNPD